MSYRLRQSFPGVSEFLRSSADEQHMPTPARQLAGNRFSEAASCADHDRKVSVHILISGPDGFLFRVGANF
jgi:hypothetical protein